MDCSRNHIDSSKNQIIILIDGYKFDVTAYANDHPGGKKILQKYNKKDATQAFNSVRGHCDGYVLGILESLCIGPANTKNNKI